MKYVIIYGVSWNNLKVRRYIEKFLDDEYEILGYSDGHYTSDVVAEKTFFKPEDICKQPVDFILVNCKTSATYQAIRRNLVTLGVSAEKIIRPTMLTDGYGIVPIDLVDSIAKQYNQEQGLIFGMSYSTQGILENNLESPFYDCSWPYFDLYYNLRIYDYMCEGRIFSKINAALWVFPYYYFDYDFSLTSDKRWLSALWRLNDWHNCREDEQLINFKMFAKKVTEFFQMPKCKLGLTNAINSVADGTETLGPLWFLDHEATVLENINLFMEFFNKLKARGGKVILIIPPFYLNGLNEVSKNAFFNKKDKFYSILHQLEKETGKIPIFDYADRFAGKRENFCEFTHMNITGAAEFTEILNNEVIRPYILCK